MTKQIYRRPLPTELPADFENTHPLLQRIFVARGIASMQDLEKSLYALLPFNQLLNIDSATTRLIQAIYDQEKILIVGDFDADGATSTAVAVNALRAFGAQDVDYLVPNRFTFGYGLTPAIVEVAKEREPDLIITVDNGIASIDGVAKAKELGIDVIVTDHHLPAEQLPDAVAIVNPNQKGDLFPSKNLAGVGVIFYVMAALRAALIEKKWFENNNLASPNMAKLLDLVALGTVADVVKLDKNNRILVYQGLRRICAGKARPGIQALLKIANKDHAKLTASDLGFVLGPRLNAAGRLDDMSLGIACLLAPDVRTALPMASQLQHLNYERKAIEQQMKQEAFAILDKLELDANMPVGVCLYDESWHQGVVGLVASRVKDKLHRPTIVFAKTDDNILKGSARSIKGVHIRDVLDAIATTHDGMITKFGGHAMAAGLSLPMDRFAAFQKAFAEEVARHIDQEKLHGKIETDGELEPDEFALSMAQLIQEAGPWGQGFPEPLFDGEFYIIEQRIVGERHLKLTLQPTITKIYVDAIAFNVNSNEWPNHHCEKIQATFRLGVNEFRDRKRLQLLVTELIPLGVTTVEQDVESESEALVA